MHHEAPPGAAAGTPPPPFEPLFTLLTNTTTNSTVHPRVHYLFSDDDTSVLAAPQGNPAHRTLIVDLAAPAAPQGAWSIAWASSLSPDFAVTGSHLSAQQQHDGDDGDGDGRGGGGAGALMLRVEGVEREPVDTTQQQQQQQQASDVAGSGPVATTREDTEGLADEFRRRMGVLRKVVHEGERRRALLDHQQQAQEMARAEDAADADGREESSTATATATPAIITEPAHQ
ncbi:hypothetical protein ESCO_000231 [Escovopsis weberi]|uniref:Uncharacterized protein n=1 Tax=Escovopsis weberi TaxID=150374 RepID=A0A0M8N2W4_ESCWE|nr:hypothetical protein ESCO_000231 [Escovopsis weberi]